jgi:two-component system, NtrC family, response regulator
MVARILIVEDDPGLRQVMQVQLTKEGYEVTLAANAEEAIELLQKSHQDLIITDLHMPGISGIDLLKKVRAEDPGALVILMTAYGTVQSAVEAMKSGAYDYITKPIHQYELRALVSRAIERNRLIEEVQFLRTCLDQKYGFENIIGSAGSLMYVLDLATRVAPTDATVLIQGETGTGKELVAKAIHFLSPRREKPFVVISCGAIPRELLESELFGYVKGAFTGALTHKKGKAEMADGGTLLLDEIGEMPLELQVRVMRLIQEREIEKVGSHSSTKVNVRIIAATHRNLEVMVREGTFREDLYYRLLVVPIKLPPLRERGKDIPELVQFFFDKFKLKHGRGDLKLRSHLLPYFSNYPWPGNVRQLENALERLVLLAAGPEITREDLPDFLQRETAASEELPADLSEQGLTLDAVEKRLIQQALEKLGGNQTQAARFLGISRRALAYRLERYGIRSGALKSGRQSAGQD